VLSQGTLMTCAILGAVLLAIGAIGTKMFDDFSRSDLKNYCRRRGNIAFFNTVRDRYQAISLASETLCALAGSVVFICLALAVIVAPAASVASSQSSVVQQNPFGLLKLLQIPAADENGAVAFSQWWVSLASISLVLLTIGVWIPRALVSVWSSPIIYHTWFFWKGLTWLMSPFTLGVHAVAALAWRLSGREQPAADDEEALEDEIRSIVTAGVRDGLVEEDEWDMIEGVMELGDVDVKDVMTSRSQIDALQVDTSWDAVLKFFNQVRRTRLPVYEKNLDNVIGTLYVKDLLTFLADTGEKNLPELRDILRPMEFVPSTKAVDDLLRDFQKTHTHLAMVIDEYNTVIGLVTMEDAIEEIVGEIIDEDDDEPQEIFMITDSVAEVLGRAHIDEVNVALSVQLPEPDEVDTVGGLVVHHLGYIPSVNEQITLDQIRITVVAATKRRIERLRLEFGNNAS
jgi:putative hemolysin